MVLFVKAISENRLSLPLVDLASDPIQINFLPTSRLLFEALDQNGNTILLKEAQVSPSTDYFGVSYAEVLITEEESSALLEAGRVNVWNLVHEYYVGEEDPPNPMDRRREVITYGMLVCHQVRKNPKEG